MQLKENAVAQFRECDVSKKYKYAQHTIEFAAPDVKILLRFIVISCDVWVNACI